ncbi:MAG: 4-alpha-glucanotransferase, partial [Microbacteriaceae bacterium]|nr:4-alpha-glucanotransferase [Burkholderiaceae bacterium]
MRFPRASGVLLHPTSLPGPHGSGDLGPAAHHFIDWLHGVGQSLWQMLPLGGIGPGDSPYMSPSAFAGNVLLIDLADLQQRGWLTADAFAAAPAADPCRIDYATMVPYRLQRLAEAAPVFATGASAADRAAFNDFCAGHADWLADYSLFMALNETHGGADWSTWGDGLARRAPHALAAARAQHAQRIAFWAFCQWCFFRQWAALRVHAHSKGVKIIGDTPIFIAHQSADVWARPELFQLNANGQPSVVAGVPPDYFSATGQRWGNPLYRWDAHAAEGYAWWVQRLRHTLALVDIVRIDHFRG